MPLLLLPPPAPQNSTFLPASSSPTPNWPSFFKRAELQAEMSMVATPCSVLRALWFFRPGNYPQSTSHWVLSPRTRLFPKIFYNLQVPWTSRVDWQSIGRCEPLLCSLRYLQATQWSRCYFTLQAGTGMTSRSRTSCLVWGYMPSEMFGRSRLLAGSRVTWPSAWPSWTFLLPGSMWTWHLWAAGSPQWQMLWRWLGKPSRQSSTTLSMIRTAKESVAIVTPGEEEVPGGRARPSSHYFG